MDVIGLRNVSYRVRQKELIRDVSFQVEEGDAFALLGENGSGKSTLIDLILGDLTPQHGSVELLGSPSFKPGMVGVAYDQPPLLLALRVEEIVRYFATLYNVPFQEISPHYFELFGLESVRKSLVEKLSQGEKKKIGLLLAVINKPKLLVLDEPFTSLDPTVVGTLWDVFRKHAKTVFFTSHDWKEAERIATKIGFLRNGRLLHQPASPSELLRTLPAADKVELEDTPQNRDLFGSAVAFSRDNVMTIFYDRKSDFML